MQAGNNKRRSSNGSNGSSAVAEIICAKQSEGKLKNSQRSANRAGVLDETTSQQQQQHEQQQRRRLVAYSHTHTRTQIDAIKRLHINIHISALYCCCLCVCMHAHVYACDLWRRFPSSICMCKYANKFFQMAKKRRQQNYKATRLIANS